MKNIFLVISVVALLAGAAHAQKVDVTGKWVFNVQTDQGSGSPTFTFKQEGEKLSGRYSGLFGEADLTGTVKGNAIQFTFKANAQGTDVDNKYEGTVDKDTMKGTLDIAGFAAGTFTGKRQ